MDERNFTYMFYGFTVAWALVVLYVITLVARERKIGQDLSNLRRMLEDKEQKKP